MIDTHAHVYSHEFDDDAEAMLQRAKQEGIEKIYMPAIDSTTHDSMLSLASKHPDFCLPMIGLHPCSVKADYEAEIEIIKTLLTKQKFYGIGETGIDAYWDTSFIKEQEQALRLQAELAIEYQLPLILHTRNATQQTIDILQDYRGRNLKGIFHCFGGTVQEANQIIDLGFHLGIGGVASFKNGGLKEVLPAIELRHIVLETDAPYLAPVPYRGKRNEPAYLQYVVQALAQMLNIHPEEIKTQTTQNASFIFNKG